MTLIYRFGEETNKHSILRFTQLLKWSKTTIKRMAKQYFSAFY